jgi:hypothetical protein
MPHRHKLIAGHGSVELATTPCDGVYWSGQAWRVCLSEWLGHDRPLEPIETKYHGGEDGCRSALAAWLAANRPPAAPTSGAALPERKMTDETDDK